MSDSTSALDFTVSECTEVLDRRISDGTRCRSRIQVAFDTWSSRRLLHAWQSLMNLYELAIPRVFTLSALKYLVDVVIDLLYSAFIADKATATRELNAIIDEAAGHVCENDAHLTAHLTH